MENIDELLQYESNYKVVICKQHLQAVQNIDRHLEKYHSVAAKDRRAIVNKYAQYTILEPPRVPLPAPLEPPLGVLGKPIDGFLCEEEECGFISINRSVIAQHCNKVHDWQSTKRDREHWSKVKVQTFFRTGGFQRYFVVHAPEENGSVNPSLTKEDEAEAAAIKREWKEIREERKKALELADEKVAKTDRTGWFNRTGWPEHLAGRNLKHLARASRLPDRNERELQQATKIVDLAIERSVAGLSTLAVETRRWLRSAKREEIDVRPMARLQNPESQSRYAGYMRRFVCYCLRIAAADQEAGDGEESEDEKEEGEDGEDDEDSGDDGEEESRAEEEEEEEEQEVDPLRDARKLFVWQGDQKELAKEMLRSLERDGEETQVGKMIKLLGSFVFQTVGDRPFDSGLVHFLAVLGIDEEMNRLRTADNFSYMLAGVVYCVRALAVEVLLPSAQRDEQGDAERKRFLRKRRQFLADGSYSPMSTMISLLAYGKSIALNTSNAGSVQWSVDKKVLYLHGRPIVIERFRRMVREVVKEAERVLWEELMWTGPEGRVSIPLDKLADDVTFTKRGISFVSKSSNGLAGGLDWMIDRMLTSDEGRKMRTDGVWNARRIRRYLRKVDRCLELLLFSTHTTYGQPGRGTEITTVRHQNGFLQDRNIFAVDGRLVVITRYHKSQSQFDKPKIVPRFLPWRVGQLMAVYLAYVRPFREHLMVQLQGGGGWSDHVWADANGPWETDRLTAVIARETASRLGERLTTLDYRHVAISVGRVFVGEQFASGYREEIGEVEEPEVEVEDPLELSAARTEKMGVQRYGVPSDIIKHLSVRSMETFRPLSEAWHGFLGLSSDAEEEERTQQNPKPAERSKKRGREDPGTLCIRSAPPKLARAYKKVSAANREVHKGVSTAEVKTAMQRALGQEDVSFRSKEQELAMEAVLAGQTPLVVVLPTGGGKSLLFTVPACLEDAGATIVVAPFRALVDDLVDRLKKAGVDCVEWRPGEQNPAAVVVVSADFAANWDFLNYGSLLSQQGHLRRVVIDECHLTFTSSDYRPKLAHLKQLRALKCPMILLTATLPPLLEDELSESMLVRCARYVRAVTVRKNIRYMVQRCARGKLVETAVDICRRQLRKLVGRKGVVYCRSRAQCEEMAEELGCGHYHAGSVDKEERLQAWLEKGGLMVATSALGTGVDYPGIVFVLHVGMPYGMIDFAQESGRAGRAGEAVDSMILVEEGATQRRGQGEERTMDEAAMAAFIEAEGCRRGVMSGYLDGQETECSQMDMAPCDRCGEGVREWQVSQVEAAEEWRQVKEVLDEVADGCAACWMTQEGEEAHLHSLKGCQRVGELTQAVCDEFRRRIVYEVRSHSCTRCGISQRYCATGVGEGMRCQWPNVLVPIVRGAMGSAVGMEVLRRVGFKGGFREWEEYGRWLGQRHKRRVWGEWMSNAMVVLIEITLFMVGESR